jgi:hypothetical protein
MSHHGRVLRCQIIRQQRADDADRRLRRRREIASWGVRDNGCVKSSTEVEVQSATAIRFIACCLLDTVRTERAFAGIGVFKIHGKFDPLVQWLQRRGSQMSVQSQPHTSIDDVATMFCADVTFFVGFANLGAQFRNGRIERVDVLDSAIQTAAGIHIGSTEQQVRDAYSGRLLEFEGDIDHSANVSDSSQTQGEHAFIVKSPDYDRDQLALLIETNGTEVVGLHTGTKWAFGRYNDSVEAKSCLDFGEEDTPNSFD